MGPKILPCPGQTAGEEIPAQAGTSAGNGIPRGGIDLAKVGGMPDFGLDKIFIICNKNSTNSGSSLIIGPSRHG